MTGEDSILDSIVPLDTCKMATDEQANMKLCTLDHEIGYTASFCVDDREKLNSDGPFSDSFLHMDTGINEQESKIQESGYSPNMSYIGDLALSEQEDSVLIANRDINDSTIREIIVEPRKLSLKNTVLDDSSEVAILKHLTSLDLSCNQLVELNGLTELVLLADLNVSDNKITCLDPLKNLKNLVRLDASKNSLKELDFQDVQYFQLQEAIFVDNQISNINAIENLSELKIINLNNNEIRMINFNSSMDNLDFFSVRRNKIKVLELDNTPNLQFLDAGENCLSIFKCLESMPKLSTVILDRQNSSRFTFDLSKSQNLKDLNLSNNISIKSLEGVPSSILNLSIRGCSLSNLACTHLKNLIFLDASENNLTDISQLCECRKLERLYLLNNQIENIDTLLRVVKKCIYLVELDARFNPINLDFYALQGSDDKHLETSDDECIVKRICYRSLLIHYSNLNLLDGLKILAENRKSASRHVSKFKKAMYCVTSIPETLFQDWTSESKPLLLDSSRDFFIVIPDF